MADARGCNDVVPALKIGAPEFVIGSTEPQNALTGRWSSCFSSH
jgi:hypothetical protein